jgi:hypothetical protein
MKNNNHQKELINKAKEIIKTLKGKSKQDDNTLNITGEFRGNIVRGGSVSGSITANISNRDDIGE